MVLWVFNGFYRYIQICANFHYDIHNQRIKIRKHTQFQRNRRSDLFGTLSKTSNFYHKNNSSLLLVNKVWRFITSLLDTRQCLTAPSISLDRLVSPQFNIGTPLLSDDFIPSFELYSGHGYRAYQDRILRTHCIIRSRDTCTHTH